MVWFTEELVKVLALIERIRFVIVSSSGGINANYYNSALRDLSIINGIITRILLRYMTALEVDADVREQVTKYEHIKKG